MTDKDFTKIKRLFEMQQEVEDCLKNAENVETFRTQWGKHHSCLFRAFASSNEVASVRIPQELQTEILTKIIRWYKLKSMETSENIRKIFIDFFDEDELTEE